MTGVQTCALPIYNDEQAEARMADKGTDAARVAVEMANLVAAMEELAEGPEDD